MRPGNNFLDFILYEFFWHPNVVRLDNREINCDTYKLTKTLIEEKNTIGQFYV